MAFKFGNINFPPGKKKDEAKEFVPAERPIPLAAGVLHESPKDLERHLEEYVDAMNEYATQHDVFISNEKKALNDAKGELVGLSEVLAKTENPHKQKELEGQMSELLEKINGPLTKALNDEIAEFEGKREKTHQEAGIAGEPLELTEEYELPPDATPAETKQSLRANVTKVVSLEEERAKQTNASEAGSPQRAANGKLEAQREMSAKERAEMKEAEDAYFAAYKEHYSQKGAKESNEPEELVELKRAYDEKRIAYGFTLTKSAFDRLSSRNGSDIAPERMQSVLDRYNRLVRYNEIIKPTAEKRYAAKLEALGERPKGIFMKSGRWLSEQNKKLENRYGKVGARLLRATAVTAVAGTLGVSLGTVSAGALLGWGAFRVGRSLATGFASMGIGMATGEVAGLALGAKRKQTLESAAYKYVGRTAYAELTPEMLEEYDAERQAFEKNVNETTLQNRKQIARAIGALVGGAGIGFLENLPSMQAGANEIAEHNLGVSIDGKGTPGAGVLAPGAHSGSSPESLTTPSASTHEATMTASAAIGRPGEGTDQLFVDLKQNIRMNGMATAGPQSAALKHLLETHPNELSRSMGSIYDGHGMVVHRGDMLSVDENQNVYFTPNGGRPQLFIQNDPSAPGGYKINPIEGPKPAAELPVEKPNAPVVDSAPSTEVQPATPPAAPAVPDAAPSAPVAAPSPETVPAPAPIAAPAPENIPVTPSSPIDAAHTPEAVPTPMPAPVPEAMTNVPAPAAPEAATGTSAPSIPETTPAPSIAAEAFTNAHGISIDPTSPHLYEMKGLKNVTELWGGAAEDRDKFLETYFADPQNDDKIVWVTLDTKSGITGKPVTMAFTAQGAGAIIVTDTKGDPIVPPDPSSFTKRIK